MDSWPHVVRSTEVPARLKETDGRLGLPVTGLPARSSSATFAVTPPKPFIVYRRLERNSARQTCTRWSNSPRHHTPRYTRPRSLRGDTSTNRRGPFSQVYSGQRPLSWTCAANVIRRWNEDLVSVAPVHIHRATRAAEPHRFETLFGGTKLIARRIPCADALRSPGTHGEGEHSALVASRWLISGPGGRAVTRANGRSVQGSAAV